MLTELFVEGVSLVGDGRHLTLDVSDFLEGPLLVVLDLHMLTARRGEHSGHLGVAAVTILRAAASVAWVRPFRAPLTILERGDEGVLTGD